MCKRCPNLSEQFRIIRQEIKIAAKVRAAILESKMIGLLR